MTSVIFLNNDGGGFAASLTIDDNTTIAQLFTQQMHGAPAQDYIIKVNGAMVPGGQILQNGDKISVTPAKIEGADG